MRCYKRRWRLAHGVNPMAHADHCSVDGCDATGKMVRGLCRKHYNRLQRHGDPQVILATERGSVQVEVAVFNGIEFRRYPNSSNESHRRYFKPGGQWVQRGVGALHQEVWKHHRGPIPDGWHVHHKNGDFLDNRIENLECLPPAEHYDQHQADRSALGRSPAQQAHLDRIRSKAAEWHRSEAGRAWHREHARQQQERRRAGLQPDD